MLRNEKTYRSPCPSQYFMIGKVKPGSLKAKSRRGVSKLSNHRGQKLTIEIQIGVEKVTPIDLTSLPLPFLPILLI